MKKNIRRIALAGTLSAAAFVLMYLGSLIEVLDMTAAFAAGFAVIIAMIECDRRTAIAVYAVSGVLAALLILDKFTAVSFICYGGVYPIIKELCEKIKLKPVCWIVKFVISNILLTAIIWLGKYFTTGGSGDPLGFEIWVYLLGNCIFFTYDIALTLIITKYFRIFKKRR